MSLDVNGRFLTRATHSSPELLPFTKTSATGTTSGLRQGTLLTEGELLLQVIRLGEDRVRLRVTTGTSFSGDAGVNFNAHTMAFYRFLPSANIDRARSLKVRVDRAYKRIESLGTVEERIERLRGRIGHRLDQLLMLPIPVGKDLLLNVDKSVDWAFDRALEMAESASSVEEIEAAVFKRTERLLSKGISDWNTYVEPVFNTIKRFSSRTYNLNASVVLNGETARRIRTLADYEFDLSDESARIAFDRAITGRALWMDIKSWFGGGTLDGIRLSDLTLAEDLAASDVALERPRVTRHATAFGDLRTQHYGVRLSGLWMSFGVDWNHANNRITLVTPEGDETEWEARAWQFDRKTSFFGQHQQTSFASGAFIERGHDDLLGGGYWFSWNKAYPTSYEEPVARSLSEFLNLLGPVAVNAGLPALYDGEHEGRVSASLDVIFSGEAMDYLFDPVLTEDALLWRVFGEVADTFDNRYEIPLIIDPLRPAGLSEIEGGIEACEKVANQFGGWYCAYFYDTFVPALRMAQESPDPAARLAFLEQFYEKGFFGKPVGSRLLVRYLASLMDAIGLSDEISVRAQIRNNEDNSESASPSLERGNPETLALIETMTPAGLK